MTSSQAQLLEVLDQKHAKYTALGKVIQLFIDTAVKMEQGYTPEVHIKTPPKMEGELLTEFNKEMRSLMVEAQVATPEIEALQLAWRNIFPSFSGTSEQYWIKVKQLLEGAKAATAEVTTHIDTLRQYGQQTPQVEKAAAQAALDALYKHRTWTCAAGELFKELGELVVRLAEFLHLKSPVLKNGTTQKLAIEDRTRLNYSSANVGNRLFKGVNNQKGNPDTPQPKQS